MAATTGQKKSNIFVWLVLLAIIVSLMGFGVRSIGNSGAASVATVGAEKVTVNEYTRALSNELRALSQQIGRNITIEQARAFGIDQIVLRTVLGTAALDNEARRIGLSVGDQLVKKNLLATQGFQGMTGKFDEATYKDTLKRANLTPSEYDVIVRKKIARTLMQIAVGGGIQADDTFALSLYAYIGETRDLRWAPIDASLLPDATRAPTDSEIAAQYKADPKAYTAPEIRKITYVSVSPDDIIGKIKVDDKALKALYDRQANRFHIPARRVIDRLVYPDSKAADAAFAALKDNSKTFLQLVTDRGLTLDDISLGQITREDLKPAAADAVFALKAPGVAGPVESDLGPAIFRVNAILDAKNTSFKDAKAVLRGEYVADRARRNIDNSVNDISDILAGGATLEEVAAETDMKVGTLDLSVNTKDGIAKDKKFRKAANDAVKGDFPKVLTLADGGIFALRLDAIVPPTLRPLSEVRAKVIADWTAAQTRKRLMKLATKAKSQLDAGQDFAAIALTAQDAKTIRRQSVIENAPTDMVSKAFSMAAGDTAVVSDANGIALVKLVAIHPFDKKDPANATALAGLQKQISDQIGGDIFSAFATAVEDKAGITINRSVINAVQTQIR